MRWSTKTMMHLCNLKYIFTAHQSFSDGGTHQNKIKSPSFKLEKDSVTLKLFKTVNLQFEPLKLGAPQQRPAVLYINTW